MIYETKTDSGTDDVINHFLRITFVDMVGGVLVIFLGLKC